MGKRALWMMVWAGLTLLLVSLGCGVSPPVPQLPEVTPEPSPIPSTPGLVPSVEVTSPSPTLEAVESYTNDMAGFRLRYPAEWVYVEEKGGATFAMSAEALDAHRATPRFVVFAGDPEDVARRLGVPATAQDLLDGALEDVCGLCEVGEREQRVFGETPGVGVAWSDSWDEVPVRGHLIAAVTDQVGGIALAVAPDAEWASFGPIFEEMFSSLEFFPPQSPEPIERGAIQPGEIAYGTLPLGGTEVWRFDVTGEHYVTIRLDAVEPDVLDTYLELYDGQGVLVAEDDDGGTGTNSTIVDFRPPVSGTYAIHVRSYEGQGNYFLTLRVAEGPSGGGEIVYGQTVRGMLTGSAAHEWAFAGAEGDVVTIAMDAVDGGLDCFLELHAPDGVYLTSDDDSGEGSNALIEYYTLFEEGVYRIVASSVSGEPGEYELALKPTGMITTGVLTYGGAITAALEPGTRHHWFFRGESGDAVTIAMTALDGEMDPYLELFAPNGVRVMIDDDGGGGSDARIDGFVLPSAGVYRIIARGYGDDDGGDYELILMGAPVGP